MTREALRSTWRGSYMFASAVNGLEERMKGPHYDVYLRPLARRSGAVVGRYPDPPYIYESC